MARLAAAAWASLALCLAAQRLDSAVPYPTPVGAMADVAAPAQPVSGAVLGNLQDYGRQVGEQWLKESLGVDLQAMQIVWDPETRSFTTVGDLAARQRPSGSGSGQDPASGLSGTPGNISLKLTQTESLARLGEGVIPFGLEVKGVIPLLASLNSMDARLKVPLSPYDEWRAEASLPMDLMGTTSTSWWRGLGLGRSLALRSNISSRLGLNELEAGLGTDWRPGFFGRWNLDYDWRLKYGQGLDETTQWLKLSKNF